jgi:Oxysterol-binding protein
MLDTNFEERLSKSYIAPTDTRYRPDQRLFEEGKHDEADREKVRLEEKQRKTRKIMASQEREFKPLVFEKGEMMNPVTNSVETVYNLIKGKEGYWERRK